MKEDKLDEVIELHLDACPGCPPTISPRLYQLAHQMLRLPFLQSLRKAITLAGATAEPAGRLHFRSMPARRHQSEPGNLTVLSANLWHDWPRYRCLPERLEDFARLVEQCKADLVLLQEVARTPNLRVDEWLGKRLGMAYAYSRSNGHVSTGFEEGLAILSRFPLHRPQLRQLSDGKNPFVRRMALGVEVETPTGRLLAFSAHLGIFHRQNARQIEHLKSWINGLAGNHPSLVGGDFNAHETTARIRGARRHWQDLFRLAHPSGDGATHEIRWPWGGLLRCQRLDYLFLQPGYREWQVLEARHCDAPGGRHSDHRAVLARLASVP